MTPDQRRLLVLVTAWAGDLSTSELCDEEGLDVAAVTRRDLPALRELLMVEPAVYHPLPKAARWHMPGTAGHCAHALSKWGPMSRAQIAERAGYLAHLDATGFPPGPDWQPPPERSGAFKRALREIVDARVAIPPAHPVPTPVGAAVARQQEGYCEVEARVKATLEAWLASARGLA